MMSHNGGRQANERIERTSSGQAIQQERFSSTTSYSYDAGDTRSHSIMINSDTTNGIQVVASSSEICQATSLNYGTSQGEDPISPSATNGIQSSSEICQATSSLNSGTSQGEDPSLSAAFDQYQINGGEATFDEYCAKCVRLLRAAMKGDWSAANAILKKYPDYVRVPITKEEATVLHIAVAEQHTTFLKKLLKLMDPDDLKLKTNYGFTALHSAAQVGNVRIAKPLFEMNDEQLLILDANKRTPLIIAALLGHANMVSYLFSLTHPEKLTNIICIELLLLTIHNDMYDIALQILNKVPNIATVDTECWWEALKMLAKKPFAIGSESQPSFWESLLNSSIGFKGIYHKAFMKTSAHQLVKVLWKKGGIPHKQFSSNMVHNNMALISEAAKCGNVEFLIILARSYPDLIWKVDEDQMSIFHFAILHRHESVFNLIYEIHSGKVSLATFVTVKTKENMLHLAGKLAPSDRLNIVSGAALQMQRELLWFKEIERIVPQSYLNRKNFKDQTPKEIFIEEHKGLQKAGEQWMKDTANFCMVVATLIATVIFAAAFTVPGGSSSQQKWTPIFLSSNWFMIFFISDAIALCSSSTSIVIFLSILMSRYTEEDFLKSLPSKLLFGLTTLFISVVGMMVAFIATFFLLYTNARLWASVVGIISASIPIITFVLLHCKLWVDIFRSTYKSRFLFRSYKHRLF